MNYISQYDKNMTKGEYTDKNIQTGGKWKVDSSVPLLKLLKANDLLSLFRMSCNNIKYVETDDIIPQFYVVYMSMPFSKKRKRKKTFREQVETITKMIDTKTSQAIKKLKRLINVFLNC